MSEQIQIMRSNGTWRDASEEQATTLIDQVIERENWYAERVGRSPLTSPEDVVAYLGASANRSLKYDDDWDSQLRVKPEAVPASTPAAPTRRCKRCGRPATMNASMGPACTRHYDALSY